MSSALEAELRARLTAAMKAKDLREANLIRMINTKITERRTADGFQGVVDDALVLDVITVYRKSLEKAKRDYEAIGERGAEHAEQLAWEAEWCSQWLPKALDEAELRQEIATIVQTMTKDPKQAGRVVGELKKKFGDRVDAVLAKKIAEDALS